MRKMIWILSLTVLAFSGAAVFAESVPWSGDRIVINEAGTYTLDETNTASGVYFNTPATLNGATLTLSAPAVVYGTGSLMTPLAGSDGLYVSNRWDSTDSVFPQTGSNTLLLAGASIAQMTNICASIGGFYATGSYTALLATKTVAFTKNEAGTEVTAQFHATNSSWAVAFKVKFTQSGSDIYGEVVWAKYWSDKTKSGQDWDINPPNTGTYGDYAAPYDKSRICITKFLVAYDLDLQGTFPGGTVTLDAGTVTVRPDANVTITACATGRMDKLAFAGSKTSLSDTSSPKITFSGTVRNTFSSGEFVLDGITVDATCPYLLPTGANLVLTNYASYTAVYEYMSPQAFPANCTVTVNAGCRVSAQSDWSVNNSATIIVNGGEFNINTGQGTYLQHLTLRNGGKVTGLRYVVGYTTTDSYTYTYGTGTCIIESAIRGAKNTSLPSLSHVFKTEADLRLTAGLGDYGANSGITWVKRGGATLAIEGNGNVSSGGSACGPFTVEEGKLFLGANNVIARTNAFTLAGGALDGGAFTNRLGTLTVTTNATLVAGTGALTFSDASATAWTAGARLSITGATETLTAGHIRFLGTGLTPSQLDAMRYNGTYHLKIDGNGWIRSYVPGLTLLFL